MGASVNPYAAYLGDAEPMAVLSDTVRKLVELTAGLSKDQLAGHPLEGKWSIHESIAHLADVEMVMGARCRWILFEPEPRLIGFDQDAWVMGWAREQEPIDSTLERFRVLREANLRLFHVASPEDLRRTGIHAERGSQTVLDYIALLAGHDINHLQQIGQLRSLIVG
ncbi:MAG TPA: DinB family protein [Bryobacteraceae bacterium]|nr:DinB family protein [Bryobacteraceae bacterium]